MKHHGYTLRNSTRPNNNKLPTCNKFRNLPTTKNAKQKLKVIHHLIDMSEKAANVIAITSIALAQLGYVPGKTNKSKKYNKIISHL